MQRLTNGTLRFSPRDLIAWLEGDFASWCERFWVERENGITITGALANLKPDGPDEEMALAARRGDEHEQEWLARLKEAHPDLLTLDRDASDEETFAALRTGASMIYQAHLAGPGWHGYSDFLQRVPGASALGDFHYEPWDTKLARSAKPYFMLQLCAYADLLEQLQGIRPASFGFILGDGSRVQFATGDFYPYYERLRNSFLEFQSRWKPAQLPDPGADRSHGRWNEAAAAIFDVLDDLSQVAGITRNQVARLQEAGIVSLTGLAESTLTLIPKMAAATFLQLRQQARMQLQTRTSGTIAWALRQPDPVDPRRGLALLPPASPNDVFFDMEGFPYADNGLEYLFGAVYLEHDAPRFIDWWAHDPAEEKRAFEGFIDWAYQRWLTDPTMHIYHYANYERSTLGRLMGQYATREFEFDQLLRNHVLVDLYTVVRQGVVIGTPSYSLKDVEHLYLPERVAKVTSAGGSVVEYQRWLDSGESPSYETSPILAAIREYNRVDCESTWLLRDWLLQRQQDASISWVPPARRTSEDEEPPTRVPKPAEQLATDLLARAEAMTAGPERDLTQLLAWLLEFHRREAKPMFWRMFARMGMTEDQLRDDLDCLAGLARTAAPPYPLAKSMVYQYAFDPDQDTKLHEGSKCYLVPSDYHRIAIHGLDRARGLAEFKTAKKPLPDTFSLIPDEHVSAEPIEESILRVVQSWAKVGALPTALDELLRRHPPRVTGHPTGAPLLPDGTTVSEAIELVRRLDGSTLCIQGPPGTGKTTTAAAIIAALVADGKRVGVVANSHSVVMNLLSAVVRALRAAGRIETVWKAGGEKQDPLIQDGTIRHLEPSNVVLTLKSAPTVIGGTAWVFVRPDMREQLDYLFVDEAGQFSLANAVGIAPAARNLILLGDQMQLAQPSQGAHPGESGNSVLGYLLQHHATIPPAMGLFLGVSWRMHPDLCAFVSSAFYEGRLHSGPRTFGNRVLLPGEGMLSKGSGVIFLPVEHAGRGQGSEEEVATIAALVKELLQSEVVVSDEAPRPMTLDDILIVAPFNMQVRMLKAALGDQARVGSVDRFQGQEAPVVIVSMCASSLDDAPRGAEFLLSPNRLNVALSRAQALAIVVGSPLLADTRARTVAEMRLLNTWCRVAGMA